MEADSLMAIFYCTAMFTAAEVAVPIFTTTGALPAATPAGIVTAI